MKIAIDYQSVAGQKTGIGVSAFNILNAIKPMRPQWKFLFYTHPKTKDLNTPSRIIWESFELPQKCKKDKPDLLYSPGFAPPFQTRMRTVVTVHDLIGMIYPEHLGGASRFYWSKWLPWCIRRATTCIASSESTKKDMMRLLGIDEKRIRVIPLAANEAFYRFEGNESRTNSWGLDHFFIAVGTLQKRKNFLKLLDAYQLYASALRGRAKLVIVGKDGGLEEEIRTKIESMGLQRQVYLLGYLSDEKLNQLYNQSLGYVMPSLYEGFGLPVLEAMKCAKTGVCAKRSSLPEIAGDTAIYCNPENPQSIAEGMKRLESEPGVRYDLEAKAFERAKLFEWSKTASQMVNVFEGMLSQN